MEKTTNIEFLQTKSEENNELFLNALELILCTLS